MINALLDKNPSAYVDAQKVMSRENWDQFMDASSLLWVWENDSSEDQKLEAERQVVVFNCVPDIVFW